VNVRVRDHLLDAETTALEALVARATEADHHQALSEDTPRTWVLLETSDGLVAAATVVEAAADISAIHFVIDPAQRADASVRTELLTAARSAAGGPVRVWVNRATPSDDAALATLGLQKERDVVQMRVELPLPRSVIDATRPLAVRAIELGRDDDAWLLVNNRAFGDHPEQGHWTLATLHDRVRSAWFDPAGFLVAPDPHGSGLIGSCWTKIHANVSPPLGEIYVIAVDPAHHGQGWGRSLTVAGLEWLAGAGIEHAMLYTESTNTTAVALYASLGFRLDHVDRSYRDT